MDLPAEEGMPSASGLLRFNRVTLVMISIYSFLLVPSVRWNKILFTSTSAGFKIIRLRLFRVHFQKTEPHQAFGGGDD
jgi:hypothetical protein